MFRGRTKGRAKEESRWIGKEPVEENGRGLVMGLMECKQVNAL